MSFYFSEEDWKKKLTSEEYRVLRKKGTESPFSGKYNDFFNDALISDYVKLIHNLLVQNKISSLAISKNC